jgi:hypothetical protein
MAVFLGKTVRSVKVFELSVDDKGNWTPKATRPVFLFTFTDNSKIVLKAEVATDRKQEALKSAVFIANLHSTLTSDLGVVAVSQTELQNLLGLTETEFEGGFPRAALTYLRDLIGAPIFVWYTMSFITGLKSLEKQSEKNTDNDSMAKVGAYKLAMKMKSDPQMLPDLGKVVAVDLFSGNTDRFGPDGGIVNPGNIVFRKELDKRYTPVGVDFFESGNSNARMYTPVSDTVNWPGKLLADRAKIGIFANAAIRNLNTMLSNAMSPRQMPQEAVLGLEEEKRFAFGIQAGAQELRTMFQRMQYSRGVPSGVAQRMELLGWTLKGTPWTTGVQPTGPRGTGMLGRRGPPPQVQPPQVMPPLPTLPPQMPPLPPLPNQSGGLQPPAPPRPTGSGWVIGRRPNQ